ncbi:DJ-1/PfpI family protein [Caulobacter mirabilis]|uniref:Transcriptional regulator n=1 Tax=Caulobacter mirabilis TaxID=69666 RepID=A0A2D2AST7_9CAUL|nr:DJ-1/PfpI family protein [Caulobacter mirabilis]ATQ41078.1 transcriptional regulator [Caulobacter mirabilis]
MLIGIPVYQGVNLLDVAGPMEMFHWAQLDVELIAATPGVVTTMNGVQLKIDKGFCEASAWDVLWTPGGAPDALAAQLDDPERTYLNFLAEKSVDAKYVCSVCEGAVLGAAAGIFDGYEITTHWAFVNCFGKYHGVTVVPGAPRFHLDRNRLTGGGISSGLDESLKLIELLLGTAAAQSAQQTTQYYPDPPVTSTLPPAGTCPVPGLGAAA